LDRADLSPIQFCLVVSELHVPNNLFIRYHGGACVINWSLVRAFWITEVTCLLSDRDRIKLSVVVAIQELAGFVTAILHIEETTDLRLSRRPQFFGSIVQYTALKEAGFPEAVEVIDVPARNSHRFRVTSLEAIGLSNVADVTDTVAHEILKRLLFDEDNYSKF